MAALLQMPVKGWWGGEQGSWCSRRMFLSSGKKHWERGGMDCIALGVVYGVADTWNSYAIAVCSMWLYTHNNIRKQWKCLMHWDLKNTSRNSHTACCSLADLSEIPIRMALGVLAFWDIAVLWRCWTSLYCWENVGETLARIKIYLFFKKCNIRMFNCSL